MICEYMMVKPKLLNKNDKFFGREKEWTTLEKIGQTDEASIMIVYGRRRVGKTELLEQVYRTRQLLKFEGIESLPESEQMHRIMMQLAEYAEEPLLGDIQPDNWTQVFKYIGRYIEHGEWTLYFEEVQWLANYNPQFISELKYVWDNHYRYNKRLLVVLCGSSPSFMIKHVIESKALYNRSQNELHLRELTLVDAQKILAKSSKREVLDAYLTVGGIPEYLKRLHRSSSVFLSLCEQAFTPDAYFSREFSRIFASSMAENKHYKVIIEFLAKRKFATRAEIAKHLKVQQGGTLTSVLNDLSVCGFIEKYAPYNLNENSKLSRYCINDAYLQFYYKFIRPIEKRIHNGDYTSNPVNAVKMDTYQKWLGYAFERFCRKYHYIIADILGFRAVNYQVGAFYNKRAIDTVSNYQIDLVFERADGVLTICEIKYLQSKVGTKIIDEFERKVELLPHPDNKTIHRVLICKEGIDNALMRRHYFDNIILIDDLFEDRYWY